MGIRTTINGMVDFATAEQLMLELDLQNVELAQATSLEDELLAGIRDQEDAPESLEERPPVVTVLGLDFGSYLTGSILTETIFSWPGVGRYVLTAIDKRDLPAIQGSILFLSLVFVMVNLVTDVVYAVVDRRVGYE